MAPTDGFRITYWGTTGSLTAPLLPGEVTDKLVTCLTQLLGSGALRELDKGPVTEEAVRGLLERRLPFHHRSTYGGNTTCVEIQTPDAHIVLDAGSGFRVLGIEMALRWNAPGYRGDRKGHVILTHSHMDHTYATPFVDPYYDPRNHFTLWAPQVVHDSLRAVLDPNSALRGVYFPPTFAFMAAIKEFQVIQPGQEFHIGATRIKSYSLNHPGGALAFRFELPGRAIVFASDHEQTEDPDLALAEFLRGADLFYADAQYTAAEYLGKSGINHEAPLTRRGWGHSTVEGVVATAVAAGVRRLHLGHREPKRTDADLARLEQQAQELASQLLREAKRPADACQVQMAYEGLALQI